MTGLRAIDFFCGAGGMSYGLMRSGIRVIAGIDNDLTCKDTYQRNVTGARFLHADLAELSPKQLASELDLQPDDDCMVFAGCSPCQFWSKIRTRKEKSQRTAFLLTQFQNFIAWFRPGFVVVENVPGLATRKAESVLPGFIEFLDQHGYHHADGIVNAVEYGVPQHRRRYLLLASRLVDSIALPKTEHHEDMVLRNFIGSNNGFEPIADGHRDSDPDRNHTAARLSDINLKRIRRTSKNGGTRLDWKDDPSLQLAAYLGKDDNFRDVYGRMKWDKPAPTITTRFISLSNGRFGHPEEDRAISIREGATLQTFPKNFVFKGTNLNSLARQIGNAVPPELAKRIGQHLMEIRANADV
jgi:DNA (cytosine-5)-methyltransferase 1